MGAQLKVKLTLTGTAPILMHNARLADPLDSYTKLLKTVSSKRTKTDDDHEEMARIEFLGGLYCDETMGPYIPGVNLHQCLIEGAKLTRRGRHVERGVVVMEEQLLLAYSGPRTPDELYADKNFRSRLSVGVTTSRVMRTRPKFPQWALEAHLVVDTGQLDLNDIGEIAETAGLMIGLGDYRPRYGRFDVVVETL
jgi:hypothetical protein